ncbi:MAG: dephospho-CoA kinase [Paracoccaceae bacterium]
MSDRPFILGLTGSIGMGKSTTARMFTELGVPVWDADAAVAGLYSVGGAAVAPMKALAPTAVKNGSVDKSELKALIAQDPSLLKAIEDVVHPLVRQDREDFLSAHAAAPLVVFDIPLLFETGAQDKVDAVLVVSAPADLQKARVMERGSMDLETFEMILSRQMPDAQKRAKADYVIETLTLEDTRAKVQTLVARLGRS